MSSRIAAGSSPARASASARYKFDKSTPARPPSKRDLSARSRHIRVQLGFVYDALDSGEVEIRYVRSAANPANQLTAPEVTDRLARTIDAMSGRPAEGPPLVVDENA